MITREGGVRVLDVGAGTGWLAGMLSRRGFTVSALDLGHDNLLRASHRAREHGNAVRFVQGDIYRLPFPAHSFDAVAACEILEHLERPGDAIREVARVLRPGGRFVLSTPFRERIETTLCIHCNHKTPVNAHLHSFDGRVLDGLLAEAGLTTERVVIFGSRPAERLGLAGFTGFLPHMAWRALDALFCRALGRQAYIAVRAVRNA